MLMIKAGRNAKIFSQKSEFVVHNIIIIIITDTEINCPPLSYLISQPMIVILLYWRIFERKKGWKNIKLT